MKETGASIVKEERRMEEEGESTGKGVVKVEGLVLISQVQNDKTDWILLA